MYILGINTTHHGSICLLKDGEVILFLEEERTSRKKYSYITNDYCTVFSEVKKYTDKLDYVCFGYAASIPEQYCGMHSLDKFIEIYDLLGTSNEYPQFYNLDQTNILNELRKITNSDTKFSVLEFSHHNFHAAQAFYNSGFDEAVCVVIDGHGCPDKNNLHLRERESIYRFNYHNNGEQLYCNYNSEGNGIASIYAMTNIDIGFAEFEEGKTMGLSSYKPSDASAELTSDKIQMANDAQTTTQLMALNLIKHAIQISGSKNVCLSGGYGLNCVANYYFRKHLSADVNLYCEPIANDAGQSIGVSKFVHHYLTGDTTIRPQKSIYYGPDPVY